jgi:hypothetical protein
LKLRSFQILQKTVSVKEHDQSLFPGFAVISNDPFILDGFSGSVKDQLSGIR